MAETYLDNIENEKLTINVSGCRFETYRKTLKKYPETLLGSDNLETYYNKESNEYFFDRDPKVFRYIMNYYRTGNLHFPKHQYCLNFDDELNFFNISSEVIDDCCYGNYKSFEKQLKKLNVNENLLSEDTPKELPLKEHIWKLIDNPQYSTESKAFFFISSSFIIGAVFLNFLKFDFCYKKLSYMQCLTQTGYYTMIGFELFFLLVFTSEYFLRLFTAPNKLKFVTSFYGVIDAIAILPFYVALFSFNDQKITLFMILKLLRLLNYFEHSNTIQPLQILKNSLKSSRNGLIFFFILYAITNLIFATFLFFFEFYHSEIYSIKSILWYTIVTTTTIGYGDIVPSSIRGNILGSLCAVFGIVIYVMLVSVFILHFIKCYQENLEYNKIRKRKINKLKKIKNEKELTEVKS